VSVTVAPVGKLALQLLPQLMPLGALVTEPPPPLVTFRVWLLCAKLAPTVCAALSATTQEVAVPVQAPLQPVKVYPLSGAAVSVTCVPGSKLAVQVVPQLIPAGALLTVPPPGLTTVRACWTELRGVNVALTDCALVSVIEQLPVPVQAPLHPLNT
jgi:hypothetical protein